LDVGDVLLKPLHGFDEATDWTGILKGRVIDEKGDPVAGHKVHTSVGTTQFEDTTDHKGRFVLKGLPQGHKLRVGLYAPGYGHCYQQVTVDGNDVDIQIFPQGWDLLDKEPPPLQVGQWFNSEPITLEQLRGKVILLQIGVLLPNYGEDLTQAQEMCQKYQDQDFEIIAIHQPLGIDWAGKVTEADIEQFLADNDIPFIFCLDAGRSNGNTYSQYDVKATPALYLIDRQGKIRVSPLREELGEQIKTLLQE
jgi:hypothetical protein